MTDLSYENGGSTSSIYDYPEHLNPFYEDENHKRLRFWNPKPAAHGRSQRRGSLSSLRDGLRELWLYSSVRFGKKRSSTLGINKTSESPPPLRRDAYEADTYATVASSSAAGYRNTVSVLPGRDSVRESQSYTTTPLFVRHSRYRTSLQDRPKENDEIGFTRNDRYRSTIQNGFSTYSTGMVTSTPRKKKVAPALPYGTTPRVPQQHHSNPFDDEMDYETDTMSTISMDDSASYSETLRSRKTGTKTRTKRRAPPPPPVTSPSYHPHAIDVSTPEDTQNEDLRNLTAEIESFVRTTAGGANGVSSESQTTNVTAVPTNGGPSSYDLNNNNAQPTEIPTTVSTIESELVVQEAQTAQVVNVPKESNVSTTADATVSRTETGSLPNGANVPKERIVVASTEIVENRGQVKAIEPVPLEEPQRADVASSAVVSSMEIETVIESNAARLSPTPVPRKKSEKMEKQSEPVATEPAAQPTNPVATREVEIDFEQLALPATPVPTRRSNRERYMAQQVTKVAERPVVPKPILPPPTDDDDEEGPTTTIIVDNLQYKLKVAPIHTEIDTKIESARMKISESTGNITTAVSENGTTERRRSVRDIIESINKSQSMLKFNHDQSSNSLHSTQSTDSMVRNIRELNEREKEIQTLLHDIDSSYGSGGYPQTTPAGTSQDDGAAHGGVLHIPTGRGSYYDNLTDDNLNANLDDRNNAYGAAGGRVKKSPTKTLTLGEANEDQQFQDCINWNPVPKPRRSHALAEGITAMGELSSRTATNAS
ncbi:uncharacterized protein LOC131211957 isoform X2 [Anopheles bellator]|uniref:uncharacterized protein LOC131211957 isoform X2 n=1 Tax=Anopheles bellator TaxID=139047 RepID=UPI002648A262|nr:uncharacterized protein LOC131211957 isoform X2 [Anopheles bellator]